MPADMPHRVISLIDGYNLYHAIRKLGDKRIRWCDLRTLSECFLSSCETLLDVRFYTAYPAHRPKDTKRRFEIYVSALESSGISIIYGNFKHKERWIDNKKHIFSEEKETDVNMAVDLIDLAYRDVFDKCLIISGDSDLRPAVRRIIKRFPNKKVTIIAPPFQHAKDFHHISRDAPNQLRVMKMKRRHLETSRLPDTLSIREETIACPPDYR